MENLVKIQNELKVPKTNVNAFGKYKYRSAEDILEAVKPILLNYSATLTLSDEIVAIGNKVFLKATARICFNEKASAQNPDYYSFCTYGYAELAEHKGMSAEQATGTASSYSRKYALNGLFLIDETESDADSQKPAEKPNLNEQVEIAKAKIITATSLIDLGNKYKALTPIEQRFQDVIELANKLKTTLK
jgi:hypothetical protein